MNNLFTTMAFFQTRKSLLSNVSIHWKNINVFFENSVKLFIDKICDKRRFVDILSDNGVKFFTLL